ncbi:MAG: DUF5131 family protein [Thermofilaceae archaeon]
MLRLSKGHVLEKAEGEFRELEKTVSWNSKSTIYSPIELVSRCNTHLNKEKFFCSTRGLQETLASRILLKHPLSSRTDTRMFSIVSETWNPVTGCTYYCTYCWARRLAETKLKNTKRYRDGFKPSLNEEEFRRRFNGGVVFVSDMGDLFCDAVPDEWIFRVFEHVKRFPTTYFLFLTKNPARYLDFIDMLPPNAILGATIETDRDELIMGHGSPLSRAPLPSRRYDAMAKLSWPMKLVSVEPILDFDLQRFTEWIQRTKAFVVYIGYDNYNHRLPEPSLQKTLQLVERLSLYTFTAVKTLRPAWYEAKSHNVPKVQGKEL